jgi:hypothetical protein
MRPSDTASGRYLFWDAQIFAPRSTLATSLQGWLQIAQNKGLVNRRRLFRNCLGAMREKLRKACNPPVAGDLKPS